MSRVVCRPSCEAVDVRHLMPEYRWAKPLPGQPAGRAEPKRTREQRKAAVKARRS
jgi:hypothetical protein